MQTNLRVLAVGSNESFCEPLTLEPGASIPQPGDILQAGKHVLRVQERLYMLDSKGTSDIVLRCEELRQED